MTHVRRQIREAVATTVTGLTTTGANVFQSRVYAFEQSVLPCLAVYTDAETSDIDTINTPRGIYRSLSVKIEARCKATQDLDDTLDTICKEVEIALGTSTLSGLVKDLRLASTTIELNKDSDQKTGLAVMTWIAEYRTAENDPETSR